MNKDRISEITSAIENQKDRSDILGYIAEIQQENDKLKAALVDAQSALRNGSARGVFWREDADAAIDSVLGKDNK
ncbi:MAG: hypothetical protein NVS3B3_06020 [Aquirhabdus sp.]